VGIDSNSGVYRYTGGDAAPADGIQFIVIVIGVFAISELMLMLQNEHSSERDDHQHRPQDVQHEGADGADLVGHGCAPVVGFFVGVLPGAGATIASAMTYAMEKPHGGQGSPVRQGRHPRRGGARGRQQLLGQRLASCRC
jgi:putative tricarboxylic transport membrane protein